MWIFLGIVATVLALISAVLLIPVSVIIKKDDGQDIIFRFKVLFWTFSESEEKKDKPKAKNSVADTLKKASGLDRLDKKSLKENLKTSGFSDTAAQVVRIVADLLKEVVLVVKHCKAKRFFIRIVCAEEDAADTAIAYGRCCSVVYPITGYIGSFMKIPERVRKIDILCDYTSQKGEFSFDFEISVRVFRLLVALIRIVVKEAIKRAKEEQK